MKGRKPTKRQKLIMRAKRLNAENWLVHKNLLHEGEMHIIHRHTSARRVLKIG